MSPRRKLPAGIRGRGAVFTYTWRDHTGRQYSRKAGDTLAQAEAFKRRVDDQLALGNYRPASTTTFATYAADWIDTGMKCIRWAMLYDTSQNALSKVTKVPMVIWPLVAR